MEDSIIHHSTKNKLTLLYALNTADWICTVILLSAGGFIEVNPLTRLFIADPSLSFLIKCAAPAILIYVIVRLLPRLDVSQLRRADRFISFVLTFYVVLCVNHIANFVILFLRDRA